MISPDNLIRIQSYNIIGTAKDRGRGCNLKRVATLLRIWIKVSALPKIRVATLLLN